MSCGRGNEPKRLQPMVLPSLNRFLRRLVSFVTSNQRRFVAAPRVRVGSLLIPPAPLCVIRKPRSPLIELSVARMFVLFGASTGIVIPSPID